jgi:tetratricopeptide (TPR) repeat protein
MPKCWRCWATTSVLRETSRLPDGFSARPTRHAPIIQLGDYQAALPLLDRALRLNPFQAELEARRTAVLVEFERGREALESARRAASLAPLRPELLQTLEGLLEAHGQFEEAATTRQRRIALERLAG